MNKKIDYFSLFARVAIALSFLSAVADRFGLWTPLLGSENIVWGNMGNFIAYTGVLVPWAPKLFLPLLAWSATIAEIVLGIFLLIGFQKRIVALLSGFCYWLLLFQCYSFQILKPHLTIAYFQLPHVLSCFTKIAMRESRIKLFRITHT